MFPAHAKSTTDDSDGRESTYEKNDHVWRISSRRAVVGE